MEIERIQGHYAVVNDGKVICYCDTISEAQEEMKVMEEQK